MFTGTVKLFDLRIKSKCETEFCNEDTLIKSSCGITSMDIFAPSSNIACGGIDGIVRFYDFRFLKSFNIPNLDKTCTHSMFALFNFYDTMKIDETKKRITSINYDKNGNDLLVSYQPSNVVLLDLKNLKLNENFSNNSLPEKKTSNIKKFRVQANWNDTGPDSQPNNNASLNENTRLRFINFVDYWLEQRVNSTQSSTSG